MHIFQITWDTKDKKVTPSETLRTDIVVKILEDDPENNFYQPTESTIIFKSNTTFDVWKQKIGEIENVMYYSFCQISLDFYDEVAANIDVVEVTKKANIRILDEMTYEIIDDGDNLQSDDIIRETVQSTLKDIFYDENSSQD